MKKLLILVLALAMLLMISGCNAPTADTPDPTGSQTPAGSQTPDAAEPTPAETASKYPDFKAAACLSGAITDNGWSANMYGAIKNLSEKYGITFDYAESVTVSDMEEYLRGYANMGYNLVVAHGSQFIDIVNAVAPDYPDTIFCITWGLGNMSQHDNVICVGPYNVGALVGIVAGCVTESNKVAMLASVENPSTIADLATFELGVKIVNPDCEVITDFIGSATDASKAYEMAMSLINTGVDVVSTSANAAALGVNQAAEESGILAVGMDTDQYETAPDAVVNSVLRNFTGIYEQLFETIVSGEIEGGLYAYGIADRGIYLLDWRQEWLDKLPAEKVQKITETIEGITNGTIQEPPPTTY